MPHILIVDDHTDGREALAIFLRRDGYRVECAVNGQDALVHIIAQPPDLIILDLNMPEMDGKSLLQVMRSYVRLRSIPVIVWTGAHYASILADTQHLKIAAVLPKLKTTFGDIHHEIQNQLLRSRNDPNSGLSSDASMQGMYKPRFGRDDSSSQNH